MCIIVIINNVCLLLDEYVKTFSAVGYIEVMSWFFLEWAYREKRAFYCLTSHSKSVFKLYKMLVNLKCICQGPDQNPAHL